MDPCKGLRHLNGEPIETEAQRARLLETCSRSTRSQLAGLAISVSGSPCLRIRTGPNGSPARYQPIDLKADGGSKCGRQRALGGCQMRRLEDFQPSLPTDRSSGDGNKGVTSLPGW
jgi:hypothetical protein